MSQGLSIKRTIPILALLIVYVLLIGSEEAVTYLSLDLDYAAIDEIFMYAFYGVTFAFSLYIMSVYGLNLIYTISAAAATLCFLAAIFVIYLKLYPESVMNETIVIMGGVAWWAIAVYYVLPFLIIWSVTFGFVTALRRRA